MGSSWRETRISADKVAVEDIKAADLNGDGKVDIVAAARQTQKPGDILQRPVKGINATNRIRQERRLSLGNCSKKALLANESKSEGSRETRAVSWTPPLFTHSCS